MKIPVEISPTHAKTLVCVMTVLILGLDVWLPGDVNAAIFYVCVIVVLAWTQSTRWLWSWTAVLVVITLVGLTVGGQPAHRPTFSWVDWTNRYMTASMLIVTAGFVHLGILINRRLDMSEKLLTEVTERRRAEDALRKAQAELAHLTRVMTMGELAASIAHEVNQPLSAIVNNGSACVRWLAGESPNLAEAREAAQDIIREGNRAGEVITRIRAFLRKTETEKVPIDINQTIRDVVILIRNEAEGKGVPLHMELAADLPAVLGDRVQLQQVILNLVMNGIEAMASVTDRPRELRIWSRQDESDRVLVAVQDSGVGIVGENLEEVFNAFYTTKSQGMGMGLAISRSIIEDHGGQLWAESNDGPGTTFQFTLLKHS